nr:PREDICTED: tenascin-like [Paralichthys olivaceus]
MEPKECNISRNDKSYKVTGLRPSTDYIAYLYGTYKGSRTSAVSIVASTAEEPDLSRLVVSNITSDRFFLSWRTGEKPFDNFIVEVRESALPSQAMGRALPGDVRSTVMAGLKASTSYNIKLYASTAGQNTQPLFAIASTGITSHALLNTACIKHNVAL